MILLGHGGAVPQQTQLINRRLVGAARRAAPTNAID